MKKRVDIIKIYKILEFKVQKYPAPVVEFMKIQTNDPFKILISTILSARTKDMTTAKVCQKLFEKVQTFKDLEEISLQDLEKLIFPVGFYKNKAKQLKELAVMIKEEFQEKIPQTIEELIHLPGVGRKTANLVVAVAFEKPGICVDVHVHRILNRL